MSKRRLRRRIASLERRIEEHKDKIIKEQSKANPNQRLIAYWQREIEAFQENIKRAKKRLGGKG